MHREDIKAAIRKTGVSLEALSLRHGFCASAVRKALQRPSPRLEALIALHLDMRPQEIWPSRYDEHGNPIRRRTQRTDHSRSIRLAHRQKRNAA